jgi:hypothetical protein
MLQIGTNSNNQEMLVIEKEGIVFENGEYSLKTIREEIDLRMFNNVISILGYQGFDQQEIQHYIIKFGEYYTSDKFIFPETEISNISD